MKLAMSQAHGFLDRYGPWALIAGGSEGLGAEFARQLARRGLNLVLLARRPELLATFAHELEGEHRIAVRALALDLARPDLVEAIAAATTDIEVGLLVCSAALAPVGPFLARPLAEHERLVDVNCRAALGLAHHFGRLMVARHHGGILFISSMAAMQGTALVAHYAASKAYLLRLAEGLWDELRPAGVDVLGCCAGYLRTPTYLAGKPRHPGFPAPPVGECASTVAEALAALGHGPTVIPGRANRLTTLFAGRLLPKRLLIRLAGRMTHRMYDAK